MAPQSLPQSSPSKHNSKINEAPHFFVKRSSRPVAEQIASIFKRRKHDQYVFTSVRDLIEQRKVSPNGIIVVIIESKNDLMDLVQLQTRLRSEIQKGAIRSIAIPLIQNPRLLKVLRENKISEVIDPSVAPRALDFKLERHFKLVENALTKQGHSTGPKESRIRSSASKNRQTNITQGYVVKPDEPLKSKADCWLIQKKTDARRVMGKWMVDLVGPGPLVGQWVPADLGQLLKIADASDLGAELSHETMWKWIPRDKKFYDELIAAKGCWVATGKKPEFRDGKWAFVASNPRLFFIPASKNIDKVRVRYYLDGKATLFVRSNSKRAVTIFPKDQRID